MLRSSSLTHTMKQHDIQQGAKVSAFSKMHKTGTNSSKVDSGNGVEDRSNDEIEGEDTPIYADLGDPKN